MGVIQGIVGVSRALPPGYPLIFVIDTTDNRGILINEYFINSFSAKGNIEVLENNADWGESARNELSHLISALFAF